MADERLLILIIRSAYLLPYGNFIINETDETDIELLNECRIM
jgi:hypothetical protein